MQIPLLKGDKIDSNVDYRDALPTNMYAVPRSIKGAVGYMNQWFGLSEVAQGEGVDRGARWVSADGLTGHYRVSGDQLIKLNSGVKTVLGYIAGSDQASIAYSFNNVAIVADKKLYYYNPTDGVRQITGTYVGQPIDIVWADNVFILTDGVNTYHSNLLDEEEFLALDFNNAQFRPDPSQGLGVNEDNELLVFGKQSIEPYRNIGSDNFIYQRITSKFLKLGCVGTDARAEMGGFWYVVGKREETSVAFHQVRSGGEKKISTREIDKVLASYSDAELSTIIVEAFTIDSIKMVLIHLPDKVILYNETAAETFGLESAFSVIKSDVLGDNPFRAKSFVNDLDLGKWVGGDKIDSTIGFLDESKATHYDDIAEWELYTPILPLEGASISQLEINTIAGFSPDNDATVGMSITRDGLFYPQEYFQLYTTNLDYKQRFIMRRLGYVRDSIGFKFRGASRSRMNFSYLNIEVS